MPVTTCEMRNPAASATLQGARVLLVHENLRQLAYHHDLLRSFGCSVTASNSFDDGLRLLGKESWELVIVSQGTAAFEGRRVLERAIELNGRTPVLVVARIHNIPSYITSMHLGAVDYLEEPLDPSELARVVRNHVQLKAESQGRQLCRQTDR